MVRTQNGFDIAELDLELRGAGEFFGTRQAGMPGLRIANILRDRNLLELAKVEAAKLVEENDPEILFGRSPTRDAASAPALAEKVWVGGGWLKISRKHSAFSQRNGARIARKITRESTRNLRQSCFDSCLFAKFAANLCIWRSGREADLRAERLASEPRTLYRAKLWSGLERSDKNEDLRPSAKICGDILWNNTDL